MTNPHTREVLLELLKGAAARYGDRGDLVREGLPALLMMAHSALSSPDEPTPKRAYFETHSPPHCPTCECVVEESAPIDPEAWSALKSSEDGDGKLERLLSLCKCGVYVTVNEHRDYYHSAAQALQESDESEHPWRITPEVRAKMIETNTIVEIQFYPSSPVGFNLVHHYDLEAALDEALASFAERT